MSETAISVDWDAPPPVGTVDTLCGWRTGTFSLKILRSFTCWSSFITMTSCGKYRRVG